MTAVSDCLPVNGADSHTWTPVDDCSWVDDDVPVSSSDVVSLLQVLSNNLHNSSTYRDYASAPLLLPLLVGDGRRARYGCYILGQIGQIQCNGGWIGSGGRRFNFRHDRQIKIIRPTRKPLHPRGRGEWPWTTPNHDFKVTPIFDDASNGTR